MFNISPDPNFVKAQSDYRREQIRSHIRGGGPTVPLVGLVWSLAKLVLSGLTLSVRLPVSWWLKRRRKSEAARYDDPWQARP